VGVAIELICEGMPSDVGGEGGIEPDALLHGLGGGVVVVPDEEDDEAVLLLRLGKHVGERSGFERRRREVLAQEFSARLGAGGRGRQETKYNGEVQPFRTHASISQGRGMPLMLTIKEAESCGTH
jgi:hypothetical protein